MAVMKRNGFWFIYFRPFKDKKIGIKLLNITRKTEAIDIEAFILCACRSGDYSNLNPVAREACIRMFSNQKWEIPAELKPNKPQGELTLWDASKVFLGYPEISSHPSRWRYESALGNLVANLGKDTPVKLVWVPELRTYREKRLEQEAAPATINWEMSTLSRIFGVLIENKLVESNPVRLLKRLSVKTGEREVYLSFRDVNRISELCPVWFRPLIWTSYYTGMRREEIIRLARKQVNLTKRMIFVKSDQTKEGHPKRVPIHEKLVPILKEALRVSSLGTDNVFLIQHKEVVRPIKIETFKNCWPRACQVLNLADPHPRFHDLRHTWRTNARRSGVDGQVAESIMGHWYKQKSVNDRYGRIGDKELLDAIDKMTFEHGETEIFVSNPGKKRFSEKR